MMGVEWRACAKDNEVPSCDTSESFPTRLEAERALLSLMDAEPSYDDGWLEWRHISTWSRVDVKRPETAARVGDRRGGA